VDGGVRCPRASLFFFFNGNNTDPSAPCLFSAFPPFSLPPFPSKRKRKGMVVKRIGGKTGSFPPSPCFFLFPEERKITTLCLRLPFSFFLFRWQREKVIVQKNQLHAGPSPFSLFPQNKRWVLKSKRGTRRGHRPAPRTSFSPFPLFFSFPKRKEYC